QALVLGRAQLSYESRYMLICKDRIFTSLLHMVPFRGFVDKYTVKHKKYIKSLSRDTWLTTDRSPFSVLIQSLQQTPKVCKHESLNPSSIRRLRKCLSIHILTETRKSWLRFCLVVNFGVICCPRDTWRTTNRSPVSMYDIRLMNGNFNL
ncbi:hypothetical protein L9F63_012818, partial [Diploptera punctata]